MWKITLVPRARKDLLGLEKAVSEQILKKLESILSTPEKSFERLSGFNYHKLRVGDYRIIVFLDFKEQIVEVRRVGHRRNIYEKF